MSRIAGDPNDELERIVTETWDLVSPPHVCVRVIEAVQGGHASAAEFAEIIRQDPALTAHLLKLVNSAFYNLKARIDTVSRAVTVVGMRELYSLALGLSAVQVFARLPAELVDMDMFWRHSVYAGLSARAVAKRVNVLHPERLFVAGLLHDVGSLVLYHHRPEVMRELLPQAEGDEAVLAGLEAERFGFDHARLGAAVLARWELPSALLDGIAQHHSPVQGEGVEAVIIHLADALANRTALSGFMGQRAPVADPVRPDDPTWAVLGLDQAALAQVLDEVSEQFVDTVGGLLGSAPSSRD